jgi:hypothetical protein
LLTKDTQDWVARARALAPMIEAAAGRTEKERKIPADVLSAMHAGGLFHMLLPVSLGGGAVDLVTFNLETWPTMSGHAPTFFRPPTPQKPASALTLYASVRKCLRQTRTGADRPFRLEILTRVRPGAIS